MLQVWIVLMVAYEYILIVRSFQLIEKEKALRGHPEGFLGGLTLLAIDVVKSSKS